MIGGLVEALIDDLRSSGSRERAEAERRYFKTSSLDHFGNTLPRIRVLAKAYSKQITESDFDRSSRSSGPSGSST